VRCSAITKGGERCRLDATSGSYCWSHAPENAEARRKRGRRGGKARGASEMSEVKREIRTVVSDVLEGRVERGVGAVVFQGYNTLLKAVEVDRRIREEEQLLARIEQLEQAQEAQKGGRRWGA
jgi:hypothetical protein